MSFPSFNYTSLCTRLCIYEKFQRVKMYGMRIVRKNIQNIQSTVFIRIFNEQTNFHLAFYFFIRMHKN